MIKHPGNAPAIVEQTEAERVFEVFAGAPTTMFRKLVVRGGDNRTSFAGGGIRAKANVKVVRSRVAGNRGFREGAGIGLEPGAGLELVRSVVAGNEIAAFVAAADDAFGGTGGGIYRLTTMASAETLAVENSLLGLNRLGSGERNDCAGPRLASLGHNVVSTLGPRRMQDGRARSHLHRLRVFLWAAHRHHRRNPRIGSSS